MLTPQDVQKASFDRAAFGGYNMQQVDAFLQPLSEDYVTLYEENIVLKSKLRVLADALREYQLKESALDAARARAQREAEALRAKTQAQCDRMLSEAEANARQRLGDLLAQLRAEQSRVNAARRASGEFIALMEQTVAQQLTTLRLLKSMSAQELRTDRRAFDFEHEDASASPLPEPPAPLTAADTARVSRAAARLLEEVDQQTRPAADNETENYHLRGEQPNHGTGL